MEYGVRQERTDDPVVHQHEDNERGENGRQPVSRDERQPRLSHEMPLSCHSLGLVVTAIDRKYDPAKVETAPCTT